MTIIIHTQTQPRVIVPVQQLELSIEQTVGWVTEDCVECKVETITFCVQLVSGHSGQSIQIRLIHRQQWRRQFTDEVIFLVLLAQRTNELTYDLEFEVRVTLR